MTHFYSTNPYDNISYPFQNIEGMEYEELPDTPPPTPNAVEDSFSDIPTPLRELLEEIQNENRINAEAASPPNNSSHDPRTSRTFFPSTNTTETYYNIPPAIPNSPPIIINSAEKTSESPAPRRRDISDKKYRNKKKIYQQQLEKDVQILETKVTTTQKEVETLSSLHQQFSETYQKLLEENQQLKNNITHSCVTGDKIKNIATQIICEITSNKAKSEKRKIDTQHTQELPPSSSQFVTDIDRATSLCHDFYVHGNFEEIEREQFLASPPPQALSEENEENHDDLVNLPSPNDSHNPDTIFPSINTIQSHHSTPPSPTLSPNVINSRQNNTSKKRSYADYMRKRRADKKKYLQSVEQRIPQLREQARQNKEKINNLSEENWRLYEETRRLYQENQLLHQQKDSPQLTPRVMQIIADQAICEIRKELFARISEIAETVFIPLPPSQ